MFDIGWSEVLIIVVVAIVVVGPKDLPPMLRAAGKMVAKLRKTAGEFQGQFNEALREAELDGVKESIDELRSLNPMNDLKKSLNPIQAALSSPVAIAKPAPEPTPPPLGQAAQPASDADIEPAPPPPVIAAPAAVATPAGPSAEVAFVEIDSSKKAAAKPRIRKAKADAVAPEVEKPAGEAANGTTAPVKKARTAKPKVTTAPAAEAVQPIHAERADASAEERSV